MQKLQIEHTHLKVGVMIEFTVTQIQICVPATLSKFSHEGMCKKGERFRRCYVKKKSKLMVLSVNVFGVSVSVKVWVCFCSAFEMRSIFEWHFGCGERERGEEREVKIICSVWLR